jgi:hypothetical protein
MKPTLHLILPLFLAAWLLSGAPRAEEFVRYPENIAWRLVTEREIQEITGCPESLGDEEKAAPALLEPPSQPLEGIEPAPNSSPYAPPLPSQWAVPPFPQMPPALPADAPPEARAAWEKSAADPEPRPEVWSELAPEVPQPPSARVRPLEPQPWKPGSGPRELPRPFSLRRYHTRSLGFFQIALYGGGTSIRAEADFDALKAAALLREPVEGIGEEAFLVRLHLPAPEPQPSPPAEAAVPFEEVAPVGRPRPDLVDPGLVRARSAPSFQDIPTELGAEPRPKEEPPTAAPPPEPPRGPALMVLLAKFPSKGVVLELAMDERLGGLQHLLQIALLVQNRLLTRW